VRIQPSEGQIAWQELGFTAFIHFGINTYENLEWSCGQSAFHPASNFAPTSVDTDQWCEVLKNAGVTAVIITAKHHDGFCLWDTKTTNYKTTHTSVPLAGRVDVVKKLSASCEKYGLKMGIYLSMADGHADFDLHLFGDNNQRPGTPTQTTPYANYNDYYKAQLKELFGGEYGVTNPATGKRELFSLWLDGAQPNWLTKPQTYDFAGIWAIARELQPTAAISNAGPDVAWIGNEAGDVLSTQWSVLPSKLADGRYVAGNSQSDQNAPPVSKLDPNLGSRGHLVPYSSLIWYPFEADVSIRYDAQHRYSRWFYRTPGQPVGSRHSSIAAARQGDNTCPNPSDNTIVDHTGASGGTNKVFDTWTLRDLLDLYEKTVGGNVNLLLNIPPDRSGKIADAEKNLLEQLGQAIKNIYGDNLLTAHGVTVRANSSDAAHPAANILDEDNDYWRPEGDQERALITFTLPQTKEISHVVLQEQVRLSQRIEQFTIQAQTNGTWVTVYEGTSVGFKKICRFPKIAASGLRIAITQSRVFPALRFIGAYLDKNNPSIL
jgi:alpha-L-fucosidase